MRDKLKQYQKKIELQIEKERLLAKELVKNGKKEYFKDFPLCFLYLYSNWIFKYKEKHFFY
jgi:hypothetical protein